MYYLPLKNDWVLHSKKLNPLHLRMFCAICSVKSKNCKKFTDRQTGKKVIIHKKKSHLELSAHADDLKMIWYNHSKYYRQLRTLFNSLNSITVLSVTKIPSNNCKYHNIPVFCCSV